MSNIMEAPRETNLSELLALCGAEPEAREYLIAVRLPNGRLAVGAAGTPTMIMEMYAVISEALVAIYGGEGETKQ